MYRKRNLAALCTLQHCPAAYLIGSHHFHCQWNSCNFSSLGSVKGGGDIVTDYKHTHISYIGDRNTRNQDTLHETHISMANRKRNILSATEHKHILISF
jgi:hypothetical protein